MLQEGFLKVFQGITKFKNEGSFEGWVRRIMVYNAINHYKHRSRKFQEDLDQENYDAPFNDELIEKISAKEIVALIQHLPEGYRAIFNLYAIEGFTHQEIASSLGISESTSKTQLFKARKWLQQRLKND
jgi:RNA polymerase sigma-70 factor (ECF subfamily)